jgi:Domain of unknown function (DUF4129)
VTSPGGRSRGAAPARKARLVLVVLLGLLVALGAHGHFATPVWGTRSRLGDLAVAAGLEVVLVGLILVLWARNLWAPPGQRLATRLRRALLGALVVGALAVASASVALIPSVPRARQGRTRPQCPGPGCLTRHPAQGPPPPGKAGSFHFPYDVLYALVAAILLAAIVAVAIWVVRNSRRLPPPEPSPPAEEYGEVLEEALEGGRRALLALDDARAAIIACYVAMEESLANAGTARLSGETPDELLAKAASTLLVSAGAAKRLTSLFYEARFSSHPLHGNDKAAAVSALAELASELGGAHRVGAVGAGAKP